METNKSGMYEIQMDIMMNRCAKLRSDFLLVQMIWDK